MITENGSIKTVASLNEKMQKELMRETYMMSLFCIIVGATVVSIFLALSILSSILEFEGLYFTFLILFAVILVYGIVLTVLLNKTVKTAVNANKEYTYEFFKDYFTATETLNGEIVTTAKFYNNQVVKFKETKNYLFFYVNTVAACPVAKSELTKPEIETLKCNFSRNVKRGIVNLAAAPVPDADTEVKTQEKSENSDSQINENQIDDLK